MVRLGYEDQAREMSSRLQRAVLREGLREYYHPYTGRGLGARDFAWSSLIAEMAAPYDQEDEHTDRRVAGVAARQRHRD
jgi:hypothetical protein